MSAEQDASVSPTDARRRPISFAAPLEPTTQHDGSVADSIHHPALLAARIERIRLVARVAALERTLEASERRRRAIIDQYERLLADQTATTEPSNCDAESQLRSLLTRLFDR